MIKNPLFGTANLTKRQELQGCLACAIITVCDSIILYIACATFLSHFSLGLCGRSLLSGAEPQADFNAKYSQLITCVCMMQRNEHVNFYQGETSTSFKRFISGHVTFN